MSPLCPYSADYEDLTSEASVRETIFTDLLADSVAVDDEEAAEEAPVDGGVKEKSCRLRRAVL